MEGKDLPARPNLEPYKKQAKELVRACHAGDSASIERIAKQRRGWDKGKVSLADAQFTIAHEHGFESWPKFAKHVEAVSRKWKVASLADPYDAFLRAACVPRDAWHASGTLDEAEAVLKVYPEAANRDIHAAAILGDEARVRRWIAIDAKSATAKGGPYGWDALTYLCFSRYLRLDRKRCEGFVRAAKALLDAGANANTGWMENEHEPRGTWESAIYGAAGVAHQAELTGLLLEYGADPNDDETPYHVPETNDNAALKVLVESGRLTKNSLATILLRKTDWHDYEGIKWLLERGVDPNRGTRWGKTAIHNAVLSDNAIEIFEVLMDHGADPTLVAPRSERLPSAPPRSAVAMAARRGRRDVLELFGCHGVSTDLPGIDGLIAACAMNDVARVHAIAKSESQLVRELLEEGGKLLAQFAGGGNTEGVEQLLGLGVGVNALFEEGDGYFDVAKSSTALHVAAWRARHDTVKLLLERGATVDAKDGKERTALVLAVRACLDSHWKERRSPESVRMLLEAGAPLSAVEYPTGYAEVDELLRAHGAKGSV